MSAFWGVLFVGIGSVLLLNYIFGLTLPIFRIVFALAILYFGVNILMGSFDFHLNKMSTSHEALFSSSVFSFDLSQDHEMQSGRAQSGQIQQDRQAQKDKQYTTIFGDSELDLRHVDLSHGSVDLQVTTVFGESRLLVRKDMPLRVRTNSIFGDAQLPNGRLNRFGSDNFSTEPSLHHSAVLNVDANVVFGSLRVIEM